MSGYTKLFASIVSSTIWSEPDHVRLVWITMLALADRYGRVEASVPGLAHQARVTVTLTREALEVLHAPDPDSRTPDFEGRRIATMEGGWRIINHGKYRDKQDLEHQASRNAEKQQRYRERKRASQLVTRVTANNPALPTVTQNNPIATPDTDTKAKVVADTCTASTTSTVVDTSASCAEASAMPSRAAAPPIGTIPCIGKQKSWPLFQAKVDEWQETYPGVSVLVELRKARQWLIDNPSKQKTYGGMTRFLNAWLAKEQDRGGKANGTNHGEGGGVGRVKRTLENLRKAAIESGDYGVGPHDSGDGSILPAPGDFFGNADPVPRRVPLDGGAIWPAVIAGSVSGSPAPRITTIFPPSNGSAGGVRPNGKA